MNNFILENPLKSQWDLFLISETIAFHAVLTSYDTISFGAPVIFNECSTECRKWVKEINISINYTW